MTDTTDTKEITIFDVAKFIYEYLNRPYITQIKLYKLLWFCQGWHYNVTEKPLFDADFVAWKHGPVPKVMWQILKGKVRLTEEDFNIENADDSKIKGETKEIVEAILDSYGEYTAAGLRELSHECTPWKERCNNINSKAIIPKPEIKEYFCGLTS